MPIVSLVMNSMYNYIVCVVLYKLSESKYEGNENLGILVGDPKSVEIIQNLFCLNTYFV